MISRYPIRRGQILKGQSGRAILAHVRVGLALSVLHVAQQASVSLPYGTVKDTSTQAEMSDTLRRRAEAELRAL